MLTSFPAPVFSHPPIWNTRPGNVRVTRGEKAVLDCSATVGQQYNTVSMEPVHAAWTRYRRQEVNFYKKDDQVWKRDG